MASPELTRSNQRQRCLVYNIHFLATCLLILIPSSMKATKLEMPIRVWASPRMPPNTPSQMSPEFCRTKELNLLTSSVCRKKWQKQIQLWLSDMSPGLLVACNRRGRSRCPSLSRTADSPAVYSMTQEANSREIRNWLTSRIGGIFSRLVELM